MLVGGPLQEPCDPQERNGMTRTRSYSYRPANFFALRTPLLPFEELEALSHGLEGAQTRCGDSRAAALGPDRERLRSRLERLLTRPEIREALFLASPSLEAGLATWRRDPDSKKGRRAEQSLVRYLYRMASRATPFGLFAGCSLGHPGEHTRLQLSPRAAYRRHTRLDMGYLFALCEDLGRDPELQRRLRYRPNSSLYLAAGRLRYVEARRQGRSRSHHLVAVDTAGYLEEILHRTADGSTLAELAHILAKREDVPLEDAEEFIAELIDSQILVSTLSPPVTGREPIHDLLEQLKQHPVTGPAAVCLGDIADRLETLDATGLGHAPEVYRAVAHRLEELPTEVELSRLLQVDMIKPTMEATLGPPVLDEIERGVDLLRRLAGPQTAGPFDRFCQEFDARYEGRQQVPLVEVLDEEVGLGFEMGGGPATAASPLLEGLAFPQRASLRQVLWGAREELLLEKLLAAKADGSMEIEINAEDLERLPAEGLLPVPQAFQVMATVAAPSQEALDRGDLRVFLRNAGGPSGANLLGRFCHADETLRRNVTEHLRAEEEQDPETILAEVVHLPHGRVGNVLSRPVLRSYEIPFLGRSGADPKHQIPITDLLVSVEAGKVILHSRTLGRRVVPRLTSAHNFTSRALGAYRFLSSLQHQSCQASMGWNWGALEAASFLPRVTSGKLVLARARWLVPRQEIREWAGDSADLCFDSVQQWRARRRLPRWIVLVDGDNELLVDLNNPLSVETFLAVTKRRSQLVVMEFFPSPEELCARGTEGRFVHELVIPYLRRMPAGDARREEQDVSNGEVLPLRQPTTQPTTHAQRAFLPGSEWLYAKIYTGTSTADGVLTGVVGPLIRRLMASGAIDRWFFIRYGDPQFHLRLRLHGDPHRLASQVVPLLHESATPLLADGRIWRLQFETYTRELERYGSGEGMPLAERLFWADSEAVLSIVESLEGDADADHRWLLTARGIDRLLSDLGYENEQKVELLKSLQSSFRREFGHSSTLQKQLAARLRRERRRLEEALEPLQDASHPLAAGLRALDQRSKRLAPIVSGILAADRDGRLGVPRRRQAMSFVHMFTNRMLRTEGRAHELVLYDFLLQCARSRAARERSARRRAHRPAQGPVAVPRGRVPPQAAQAAGGR